MIDKTTKTVFRIHWAWNDDKEERWLGRMAKEGWHLTAPRGFYYRFEKGAPADMVYRLDYQSPSRSDRKEYLGLFKDAGWEYAGQFSNWYYFRTKAGDGQASEIHTDPESRIAKYRRLLALLVIIFIAMWTQVMTSIGQHRNPHGFWSAIRGLQVAITILMAYVVIRLLIKIERIKKGRIGRDTK